MIDTTLQLLKTEKKQLGLTYDVPDYSGIGYNFLNKKPDKRSQILEELKKNNIDVFTEDSVKKYKEQKVKNSTTPYIDRQDKLNGIAKKLQNNKDMKKLCINALIWGGSISFVLVLSALTQPHWLGLMLVVAYFMCSGDDVLPRPARANKNERRLMRASVRNKFIMKYHTGKNKPLDDFIFGSNFEALSMFNPQVPEKSKYCMIDNKLYDRNSAFKWEEIGIEYYNKIIPQFALDNAVEIKKIYKNATFSVDELKMNMPAEFKEFKEVQEIRILDPFLIANIDGMKFYVDVWMEPDFKSTRVFEN